MSERVGSDIQRLWNDEFLDRLKSIDDVIQIQSRSFSDPSLSNIDFKNEMAGLPLKILLFSDF